MKVSLLEMKLVLVDKHNALLAKAALLGKYWYLFAVFFFLICWSDCPELKKESSWVGLKGIVKKIGYWIIVLVAFLLPKLFIKQGKNLLGINLDYMALFGWITLACFLVNEVRSIMENLLECGYNVPSFLIKGFGGDGKAITIQYAFSN